MYCSSNGIYYSLITARLLSTFGRHFTIPPFATSNAFHNLSSAFSSNVESGSADPLICTIVRQSSRSVKVPASMHRLVSMVVLAMCLSPCVSQRALPQVAQPHVQPEMCPADDKHATHRQREDLPAWLARVCVIALHSSVRVASTYSSRVAIQRVPWIDRVWNDDPEAAATPNYGAIYCGIITFTLFWLFLVFVFRNS